MIGDDQDEQRKPHISLYQESEDKIIEHGRRLNGEEIRHFQALEGRVAFAEKLMGTPGNGLPTAKEPLFIPACEHVLKFSTPGGTGSKFIINACYTGETPILFSTSWNRRIFRWSCNVITYIAKLAYASQAASGSQWLLPIYVGCSASFSGHGVGINEKDVEKREQQGISCTTAMPYCSSCATRCAPFAERSFSGKKFQQVIRQRPAKVYTR